MSAGFIADISVFVSGIHVGHRAVIEADPQDVALVLRGGEAIYGNSALVNATSATSSECDGVDVCGSAKLICLGNSYLSFDEVQNNRTGTYPLFHCLVPNDEPSCVPFRDGEYGSGVVEDDDDGDGIANAIDNCPTVFNPIRPMDNAVQADADTDAIGDACEF